MGYGRREQWICDLPVHGKQVGLYLQSGAGAQTTAGRVTPALGIHARSIRPPQTEGRPTDREALPLSTWVKNYLVLGDIHCVKKAFFGL